MVAAVSTSDMPLSCACSRPEWKDFGFGDATSEQFARTQWTKNKWIYFFYRLFVLCYLIVWFIYGYNHLAPQHWQLFTLWTEFFMLVYASTSFLVSASSVARTSTASDNDLRWFHVLNWLSFDWVAASVFLVSLLFWITVAPYRSASRNTTPVTIHLHLIIPLIQIIDIVVIDFPVRILHFIYPLIYCACYALFLVILHVSGTNSQVYPVTDFADKLIQTFLTLLVIILIVMPLLHSLVWGLNQTCRTLSKKTLRKQNTYPRDPAIISPISKQVEKDNLAFTS